MLAGVIGWKIERIVLRQTPVPSALGQAHFRKITECFPPTMLRSALKVPRQIWSCAFECADVRGKK